MTVEQRDGARAPASRGELEVVRLGRRPWREVYELQQQRVDARVRGDAGDALFLVEHDPIVTLGRKSPAGDAGGVPFEVVAIERGGEATYHGPGQLVAYPILALPPERRDLHRYLRDLEGVVIDTLADFGVAGRRVPGRTGVWIDGRKVASIGVAVRRWVTWHGLSLNVATDLAAYRTFQPCGLDGAAMTNLCDCVSRPGPSLDEVAGALEARFRAFWRP